MPLSYIFVLIGVDRKIVLRSDTIITFGRQNCDVVVTDRSVSRMHARIKQIEGVLHIIDENSKFGTFLQREKVPNNWTPILDDNIIIKLGAHTLSYRLEKIIFNPFIVGSNNLTTIFSHSIQNATHLIISDYEKSKKYIKDAKTLNIPILKESFLSSLSSPDPIISIDDWISSYLEDIHDDISDQNDDTDDDSSLTPIKMTTIFLSNDDRKNPTGSINTIEPIGKKFKKTFQRKRLPESIPLSSLISNMKNLKKRELKNEIPFTDIPNALPPPPPPLPPLPSKTKFKSALFKTI